MTRDDEFPAQGSSNTSVPDARFDGLYRLAKRLCGVTIARIATDTQPSGSLEPGNALPAHFASYLQQLAQRTRDAARDLLLADTHLDASADEKPPLRFFAGYPLHASNGTYLGVFYIADGEARTLSDDQHHSLRDIANCAAGLLEHASREAASRQASETLMAQESRLSLAIQGGGTGIWDRNVVTGEIHYSTAWKALLGYAENEIGNRIEESYSRLHPDDLAYVQTAMQAHFNGETDSYEVEHRLRCRDGSYKWVCSRGKVVSRDGQGHALRMLGTTTDITALRTLSERLQNSVELITRLTNGVPGLVFQYRRQSDGSGHFSYVSTGITDMFELSAEQVLEDGERIHQRLHPDDLAAYQTSRERSARELSPWRIEYRVLLPRQGLCWRQAEARPQRDADGSTVWHGVVTDITERKRIEAELQQFATIDALTLLPNRRVFMTQILAELARIQRREIRTSSVLMCDLDHFKAVNDKWGHAVGDLALQHFARILREQLRQSDLVGRIGGEEFAVVLGGADIIQACEFAARVQQHLKDNPLLVQEQQIGLTLSIGVSLLEECDHSPEIALSRSDSALYRAKKNGRNRIEIN